MIKFAAIDSYKSVKSRRLVSDCDLVNLLVLTYYCGKVKHITLTSFTREGTRSKSLHQLKLKQIEEQSELLEELAGHHRVRHWSPSERETIVIKAVQLVRSAGSTSTNRYSSTGRQAALHHDRCLLNATALAA